MTKRRKVGGKRGIGTSAAEQLAALVVPVVDELEKIPLDLWAREHGYERLQINLLGT